MISFFMCFNVLLVLFELCCSLKRLKLKDCLIMCGMKMKLISY